MTTKLKQVKPLIIGIGVAGKRHLDAQLNLGNKTCIYSRNVETKEFYRKDARVIVFDNLEKALNWSNLVHICTPDDKHTEFVAKAIKKGKVVLCEKSFTTNLKDALYLQDLAHKYKATLIIGQNYRLTPSFAETRERIQNGQLGKIIHIETTYIHDAKDFQQRYSKQNFLYIGGSHAVDLALWIANEPVVNVTASSKNGLGYKIKIEFVSGIEANIILDASDAQIISGSELKVTGEKGQLVSHNKMDKLLFYKVGNSKPISSYFSNIKTYTIALEVKIINDYLLGRTSSHWPIPNVDEAINTIQTLDTVEKKIHK